MLGGHVVVVVFLHFLHQFDSLFMFFSFLFLFLLGFFVKFVPLLFVFSVIFYFFTVVFLLFPACVYLLFSNRSPGFNS